MSHIDAARADLCDRSEITGSADYIRANGIDSTAVEAHAGCLGVCQLEFFPAQRFDFEDGPGAVAGAVLEAFDHDGETVLDLVAWPLDAPEYVTTMFGRVGLLGGWHAFNPATYVFGKPLQIHRAPLDWLRAGCQGAVPVVEQIAARQLLDVPGRTASQDAEHGQELGALLSSAVDLTRIVVPRRAA